MTAAPVAQPATADALLDAGLSHIVGSLVGPATVPTPTAEVVTLLASACGLLGGRELRAATRAAAAQLEGSLSAGGPLQPGLHGASGAVWALVEAARATDDKALGWRALAAAAAIPVRGPDPGIARGAAGAGLAQLRLGLAYRDRAAVARVRDCVDNLVRAAEVVDGLIGWTGTGAAADHGRSARGIAGIATFLLAAGRTAGIRSALRTATTAAATLHAMASRDGVRTEDLAAVGSFLLRHWAATGDPRSAELAETAALAAGPDPAAGHLLLDLAAALGDAHRDRAAQLVPRLPRPGSAQSLSFLLRLRHGGPRPWLAGDRQTGIPTLAAGPAGAS